MNLEVKYREGSVDGGRPWIAPIRQVPLITKVKLASGLFRKVVTLVKGYLSGTRRLLVSKLSLVVVLPAVCQCDTRGYSDSLANKPSQKLCLGVLETSKGNPTRMSFASRRLDSACRRNTSSLCA